jgi:hypothetical protein
VIADQLQQQRAASRDFQVAKGEFGAKVDFPSDVVETW